jgi:hypothetical protein
MNIRIPEWVKPGLWGAGAGAVCIIVVGFAAGVVVTSWSAAESAKLQTEKAVIAALTPICVAQFREVPQAQQVTHIAALQKELSWQRSDYIEKQGWATMPGSAKPNDAVAEACASELMKAGKPAM